MWQQSVSSQRFLYSLLPYSSLSISYTRGKWRDYMTRSQKTKQKFITIGGDGATDFLTKAFFQGVVPQSNKP